MGVCVEESIVLVYLRFYVVKYFCVGWLGWWCYGVEDSIFCVLEIIELSIILIVR